MSMLIQLVKEDFGISGRGRWWRSDLHSSLVVDSDNDIFFFNARDLSGTPVDYLTKVRGLDRKSAEILVKNRLGIGDINTKETSLQVKFEKLVDLFHTSGKSSRQYWYDRCLNDSTIDRYRLGFYDGWFLIPIYNNSMFVNFQCRRSDPTKRIKFWYKDVDFKPVLFNHGVLKFVNTVYITEGMVDCLLLNQLGLPSVCSTNGAMSWSSEWIKFFTKMKSIYYIPDNDKAGIHGAQNAAKFLGDNRVKFYRFKDKAEKYGALDFFRDGGSVEDFKNLVHNESVYGFEKELI